MEFKTIADVLNAAIAKEQSAHDLYVAFGNRIKNTSAKRFLSDLAEQELSHKRMLEDALNRKNIARISGKRKVEDLHLSDYMIVETITPDSDPQQVMLFAMKREQDSYDAYRMLYENYSATELESLFSELSEEELRHKTSLERAYEFHFNQWM